MSNSEVKSDVQIGATNSLWTAAQKKRTAISGVLLFLLLLSAALISRSEGGNNAALSIIFGLSLGIVFERGRFCFYCIFRDSFNQKSSAPLISIYVAIAVGSIGYAVIFGQFLPQPDSGNLPPAAHIPPLSIPLLVGGLIFGFGMVLSGSCISGHIYRIGVGSTKSIPALIGVVLGFALGFKSWNWLYLNFIIDAPVIWLPRYLGYAGSLALTIGVVVLLVSRALQTSAAAAKSNPSQCQTNASQEQVTYGQYQTFSGYLHKAINVQWGPVVTGSLVGIVGMLAYLRIEPLGVTRQLGTTARNVATDRGLIPENLAGLDVMSGCIAAIDQLFTNNGWLISGIVAGAFVSAFAGQRFKLVFVSPRELGTTSLGGVLLGWAAMTALGCTVGVLLSGTQAFALSGWVFFLFIYLGVALGRKIGLQKLSNVG